MARSHQEIKCAKCGQKYLEEENIGSLQCFDFYYTIDNRISYKIKADHRHCSDGSFVFSIITWENWVWQFDDNIHIEKSLFKKLPSKPDSRSIVDILEYEKRCRNYIQHLMINSSDSHLINPPDDTEERSQNELSDDESFSFSSSDDVFSDEENIHRVPLENSSVIKRVCIARFDWREKFNIIQRISEYDSKISLKRFHTASRSQKYWETIEYKHDAEKQRAFKRKRLGLI